MPAGKIPGKYERSKSVSELLLQEAQAGLTSVDYYKDFQNNANRVKNDFLTFLISAQRQGKKVIGYGAAAKGNTLLNYGGVRADLLPFVVDRNPAKQGKFLPGSRIPIVDESWIRSFRPDYVVIFPWNLKEEITVQLAYIKDWGGQFVLAIPSMKVI